jgi:general secretion pathway protein E
MWAKLTERAKKVRMLATEEAERLNHEYIGTEHLLLGLVKEGSGVGANVLKNLGIDLAKVRDEVEKLVKPGAKTVTAEVLPLTPRANKVVWEHALKEATSLNHNYIGTEHLLLGLLREKEGVAAQVLLNLGVKAPDLREQVRILIGSDKTSAQAVDPAQLKFWRVMAQGIEAGKTLSMCLREGRSAVASSNLERVVDSMIASVNTDKTLSEALEEHPDVFDARIVQAVRSGEMGGVFAWAGAIVEALEKGDLALLRDVSWPSETSEYLSTVLKQAFEARASDIHFDPTESGRGLVRMRVDGVLHQVDPPEEGLFPKVIDYIKVMGAMNVAERTTPQHGQCTMDRGGRHMHISTVPTIHGERVVLRILPCGKQEILPGLDMVGLAGDDLEKVRRLCQLPSGMVIVTGPAGSGKTTLLYSMLMEMNRHKECIMTIEDPVEFSFEGLGQIQTRPQAGLTYAKVMRSVLYQDPDVIMVGELLDLETLQLGVLIANTGHLLLSTMHANTAVGVIRRLTDMGLETYSINASLAGVIAQRLVRVLCDKCKQPKPVPPTHSLPPEAAEFLSKRPEARFHGPVGCEDCRGTGYRGRTGIHEILVMNDEIRQILAESANMSAMQQAASRAGAKTLLQSGLEKAVAGITSIEEVLRVAPTGTGT